MDRSIDSCSLVSHLVGDQDQTGKMLELKFSCSRPSAYLVALVQYFIKANLPGLED